MGFLGGSKPYWTRRFAPSTMVRRSSRSRRLVSTESWPSARRPWCNASATSLKCSAADVMMVGRRHNRDGEKHGCSVVEEERCAMRTGHSPGCSLGAAQPFKLVCDPWADEMHQDARAT